MNEGDTEDSWVQIRISEEQANQVKRLVRLAVGEPFQKRSWLELGYFIVSKCSGPSGQPDLAFEEVT